MFVLENIHLICFSEISSLPLSVSALLHTEHDGTRIAREDSHMRLS